MPRLEDPLSLRRILGVALQGKTHCLNCSISCKDFGDSQGALVTHVPQSHIFLRGRDGRTFWYGRVGEGYEEEVGSKLGLLST